jgi:hypothetical protein
LGGGLRGGLRGRGCWGRNGERRSAREGVWKERENRLKAKTIDEIKRGRWRVLCCVRTCFLVVCACVVAVVLARWAFCGD